MSLVLYTEKYRQFLGELIVQATNGVIFNPPSVQTTKDTREINKAVSYSSIIDRPNFI